MTARRLFASAAVGLAMVAAVPAAGLGASPPLVRVWTIGYRAHDGLLRPAYVVLPRWYGPHDDPALPLVISPHGRGVSAIENVRFWGDLPALGRFAVVNPDGQGHELGLYSWGDPGEIRDLARMPALVTRALPWLRIDRRRVYAFGGSMGGQETLLLVAQYPQLLAGAAAFDAPTNMAARYTAFPFQPFGLGLQRLARIEFGGTPWTDPRAYAIRSPLNWARKIAFSGVPLQIWWSTRDRIVVDQARESGLLYRDIKRLNPAAPVTEYVGAWAHTAEMRASTRLPIALGFFDLLPPLNARYGGAAPSTDRKGDVKPDLRGNRAGIVGCVSSGSGGRGVPRKGPRGALGRQRLRRECLDRILIVSCKHLVAVLARVRRPLQHAPAAPLTPPTTASP